MQILQLDVQGRPQEWITPQEAACYYAFQSPAATVSTTSATPAGRFWSLWSKARLLHADRCPPLFPALNPCR